MQLAAATSHTLRLLVRLLRLLASVVRMMMRMVLVMCDRCGVMRYVRLHTDRITLLLLLLSRVLDDRRGESCAIKIKLHVIVFFSIS